MPTSVERDSNLRRLQRFLALYPLQLDLIARFIFALLPVKTGLVLTMDRTNWKFGEVNINILMLGVTHKGIAYPLLFSMLDKRGNSFTASNLDKKGITTNCFSLKVSVFTLPEHC